MYVFSIYSAETARIRLLGIVQKDRETAPTFRWRHVGLDFRGDRITELLIRNRYRYERRV